MNTFRMELLSPGWRLLSTVPTSCWTGRSGRQPAAGPNYASPPRSANDPNDTASRLPPVSWSILRSRCPERDSMQHKSVPLLIKSADDDSGTFTGLASVFDNLDHDGDIVRRGAFSKSLGSGTRRYR